MTTLENNTINYAALSALHEIIVAAGSITQLAAYLGVEPRAVTDWRRAGQISKIGALLVDRSKVLSTLFNSKKLRPDLTESDAKRLRNHTRYIECRFKQIEYESSPAFAETPAFYIQTRLGALPESEGTND